MASGEGRTGRAGQDQGRNRTDQARNRKGAPRVRPQSPGRTSVRQAGEPGKTARRRRGSLAQESGWRPPDQGRGGRGGYRGGRIAMDRSAGRAADGGRGPEAEPSGGGAAQARDWAG